MFKIDLPVLLRLLAASLVLIILTGCSDDDDHDHGDVAIPDVFETNHESHIVFEDGTFAKIRWKKNWDPKLDSGMEGVDYLAAVTTNVPKGKKISLYTLAIQGREHDVMLSHQRGNGVTLYYPHSKGDEKMDADEDGKYLIRKSGKEGFFWNARRPAIEENIYSIDVLGEGLRSCYLNIESFRVFHEASPEKSGHDNLPPQPQSGGER